MRSKKIKTCLVILMVLICGLLPSGIIARENSKAGLDVQGQADPNLLELMEWQGVIANAETGETIEFNSQNDKQGVVQSTNTELIYFNENTGEKQYFQEITIALPENVDQSGYGTIFSSPRTDEKDVISVVLGMRYSIGDSGIYRVIRIDGVYVNWEMTDPTVRLTDAVLGYQIINGIGVENGAVNEQVLWNLETAANSYQTERIAPSPWFLRVNGFVHSKTIFSGHLSQTDGESRSLVMTFDSGIDV